LISLTPKGFYLCSCPNTVLSHSHKL
jgi:hypothetical protein